MTKSFSPRLVTATGTVSGVSAANGGGEMCGIFVSSAAVAGTTDPAITVYDGTSTGDAKIVESFKPVSATYYPLPFKLSKGLHIVIAGTVAATVGIASN